MAVSDADLARALHELIAALDQRVPHIERAGEASIAHDADALRQRAKQRLEELTNPASTAPVDAVNRAT